jgi:hypothetical protein
MIIEISKTDEHKAKLGVAEEVYSYTEEEITATLEMNEELEDFRRDYRIKDKQSLISAAEAILNA